MRPLLGSPDGLIHERVRMDADVGLRGTASPLGPALVIVGRNPQAVEFGHVAADAVMVTSAEEFDAAGLIGTEYTVVTASGFELAVDLVEADRLDLRGAVLWNIGHPLMETLQKVFAINFPKNVGVCGVGGQADNTAIMTGVLTGEEIDFDSFRVGFKISSILSDSVQSDQEGPVDSVDIEDLVRIQEKLLSLLQVISSDDEESVEMSSVGIGPDVKNSVLAKYRQLENELILLKRRYDALDRKYAALASSRLGKLTLRLWERNRARRDIKIAAKDG